jgi:tRNA threonylcarbamoyladenosine biosynthesis protein TsaB
VALLLLLETAAEICSVALCRDTALLSMRTSTGAREHASVLAVFIDEILKENLLKAGDLDAVAVSRGPGSYTGLRIGVATAKGLCYAAEKPLIAVDTLQSMALNYVQRNSQTDADVVLVPMLDARRNEVYTAAYDVKGALILPVQALILDYDSLHELYGRKVVVIGDGAQKAEKLISDKSGFTYDADFRHNAQGLSVPAFERWNRSQFEDIAYFEPFYLKEFAGTVPKPKIER